MELFYDKQMIIERIDENRNIIYSPFNHKWIKTNSHMTAFILSILNNHNLVDAFKIKEEFKKRFSVDIGNDDIQMQLKRILATDMFFESKSKFEEEKNKILNSAQKVGFPADQKVKVAYLHLTMRCNFNCSYCYNRQMARNAEELDTEGWQNIIRKLLDHGTHKFVFTGGEVLLRKDLKQILETAKTQKIFCELLTNGSLLKDRFESLLPLVDNVILSLDSFDVDINKLNRSDAKFNDILDTIELFSRHAPNKLTVRSVVTKNNQSEIEEFPQTIEGEI